MTDTPLSGRVVARFGNTLAVSPESGDFVLCHARKRVSDLAVGDRVLWARSAEDQGVVLEVLPRTTALVRPAHAGRLRTIAANLDRVWVVIAPRPEPDFLLVDQILAVCEHRGIDAALLLNKIDLPQDDLVLEAGLRDYAAAGYRVCHTSVRQGVGLEEIRMALRDVCSMLAGQSGVGKSSLTNALIPDRDLRTNALSAKSGLGRHTTTTATLYPLPNGGELIDSPGVSVFGLAEMSARDLAKAYREFQDFLPDCRFGDCRHVDDMDCAVRAAAGRGLISAARYRRYCRLLAKGATAARFGVGP